MTYSSLFDQKPTKLLIGIIGIYASYMTTSLIEEKLFNADYSGLNREPGTFEKFKFGFATSLFQNIFSYFIAKFVIKTYKMHTVQMDKKAEISTGALSFGSVFLASQSLAYVSFPVQAIMKSSKILSILMVAFLFGYSSQHTKRQYLCGMLITTGIIMFTLGQGTRENDRESNIIGIVAIMISLICDGVLGTLQGEIKQKYNPNQWDQMKCLNKWAGLICFGVSVVSLQLFKFLAFVTKYPMVLKDLFLVLIMTTLGQIFIFYTIANFSPFILSIITTTRKFFTVLASIVIYEHKIIGMQWAAIGLVFVGIFIEIFGAKSQPRKPERASLEGHDTTAASIEISSIVEEKENIIKKDHAV